MNMDTLIFRGHGISNNFTPKGECLGWREEKGGHESVWKIKPIQRTVTLITILYKYYKMSRDIDQEPILMVVENQDQKIGHVTMGITTT